jgi:hypothetical protein
MIAAIRSRGFCAILAAVCAVLAARHVAQQFATAAKAPVESVKAKVALMSLNLVMIFSERYACVRSISHDCGGGVAGALVGPNTPVCATVQGERGANAIGSTWMIVSPGTAAHGIAQADSGIFLARASIGVLAQSIVADVTGVAAIAIVSQSGPSLTNSIKARMTNAALRTSWNNRRARTDILVT